MCFLFLGARQRRHRPLPSPFPGHLSGSWVSQPSHAGTCRSHPWARRRRPERRQLMHTRCPHTPPGAEVHFNRHLHRRADVRRYLAGKLVCRPMPRQPAKPGLWGAPATCLASAPFPPRQLLQDGSTAQPSLLTANCQPGTCYSTWQTSTQSIGLRCDWYPPTLGSEWNEGAWAGRALAGTAPTGPHRSLCEACEQGE